MAEHRSDRLPPGIIGDIGVAIARTKVGKMGLIFREQTTQDHGIDAIIEIFSDGAPTGRLIAAQIKCGESYFRETDENFITYRFNTNHYSYWTSHSLPVIIILVDHNSELCYWENIREDNCKQTGKELKVRVPLQNVIDADSRDRFIEISSPAIGSSEYEIFDEEDVSTGIARRVSIYIKIDAGNQIWTKASLRRLVLQAGGEARKSQYYRSDLTRDSFHDKFADVVWVYVYQNESHRDLGAYILKATWISPDLPEEFQPIGILGERDDSGFVYEWNTNFRDIVDAINAARSTKSEYVEYVESRIYALESILMKYDTYIHEDDRYEFTEFPLDHSGVSSMWRDKPTPPTQCQRLDDRISESLALLDNARIVNLRWNSHKDRKDIAQFRKFVSEAKKKVENAKYELELIK